jgi:hypothetical protein
MSTPFIIGQRLKLSDVPKISNPKSAMIMSGQDVYQIGIDSAPSRTSNNLITSKAVYEAIKKSEGNAGTKTIISGGGGGGTSPGTTPLRHTLMVVIT